MRAPRRRENGRGNEGENGRERGFVSTVTMAVYVWVLETFYLGGAYLAMGWTEIHLHILNFLMGLVTYVTLGWALARVVFIEPLYHTLAGYFIVFYHHLLQKLQPLFDWWAVHDVDVMVLVSFPGFGSTIVTLFFMTHASSGLWIISLLASVFMFIFTLWAYLNVEYAREIWWLHAYFGRLVNWLSNSTMLLIGVYVGRWTEDSWVSICFFGGIAIWFLSVLYLVRPPTDFGVLMFLVTCMLSQVLRFYGPASDTVFIYWAFVVVLIGFKTIFDPHPSAPVPIVVPDRLPV